MHKIFDTEGLGVDHKYDRRADRRTDGQTYNVHAVFRSEGIRR